MRSRPMGPLVSRHEVRDDNRRTLKVLLGIMLFLIAVSVVTIVLKHAGANLP